MALDEATAKDLIRQLAEDQKNYMQTLTRVQELLSHSLDASSSPKPAAQITSETIRRNTGTTLTTVDVESVQKNSKGSFVSAEDDDLSINDAEALFVSQPLAEELYDEEGLKRHLKEYPWTNAGRKILHDILKDNSIYHRDGIFPTQAEELRQYQKHLPYYNILEVGPDGAPLPIMLDVPQISKAQHIWARIKNVNANPNRERKAVGRITIIHEPSPLLFAALHYTMNKHFDVDELFQLLVDKRTEALPHRPFSLNTKHRKTFVWTMEYFTIVGDECKPMRWQRADENLTDAEQHIPVSRCSSVIALSLDDSPMAQIRNKARRQERKYGDVYDPFSPWHLLSMQAYPDLESSIDTHKSSRHYVNGPEAFLATLRTEYKDAQKRLRAVYRRISDLVATPPDFMFREAVRDRLLFEDDDFTYSRRYFWAYQSLGIMNEDIQEMITAYRHTFTDNVWKGSDKIIWPGEETTSSRFAHWRRRMTNIRRDIEREVQGLELINQLNEEKRKEIKSLRDNLFSGTSVLESRRSVQQQAITVDQGHNIKILTLVTIFFLPLTFVTSVFGMTNMDPNDSFWRFGVVTACICFPTYLLIGSLNTTRGLEFWSQKPIAIIDHMTRASRGTLATLGYKREQEELHDGPKSPTQVLASNGKRHGRRTNTTISSVPSIAIREDSPNNRGHDLVTRVGTRAMTPASTIERKTTIHFEDDHVLPSAESSTGSAEKSGVAGAATPKPITGDDASDRAMGNGQKKLWSRLMFRHHKAGPARSTQDHNANGIC